MQTIDTVEQLDDALSAPSPALVADLARLDGDIILLGAAGKMGPTLARQARRALREGGSGRRVIAVSRFSDDAVRAGLEEAGVETIAADLHDPAALAGLPDAPNVIYMLGTKFGTTGREYQTWATNAYLGGRAAERYARSRLVVFSSGNVYPLLPVTRGGASEETAPEPAGEYAQSCLARERIFEYFSRQHGTPVAICRLNYAIDLRYGVIHDVAKAVYEGRPIDLTTGSANVIWQGDAGEFALRCLTIADTPPRIVNVTGPETISIRWLARQFGARFGIEPTFVGEEAETALLSNAAAAFGHFGYPRVPLARLIEWTVGWIVRGGPAYDKPTHFQERKGNF